MTDLAAHVHQLARQYVESGEGTDAPAAQIRVRMTDRGRQRSLAARLSHRMPDGAPPESMRVSAHMAGAARWGRPSRETLDAVACAVRTELGVADDADVTMELRIEADAYEFRYQRLAPDAPAEPLEAAARLLLDPDHRYPGHPAPVTSPGPAPEPRPTDPRALATVRDLVEQFTALYTRVKGQAPTFGAGYSEQRIAAAEAEMGLRLPEELRALYRVVHDDLEHGLFCDQMLFPLEDVVAGYLGTEDDELIGVPEYRIGLGTAVWA